MVPSSNGTPNTMQIHQYDTLPESEKALPGAQTLLILMPEHKPVATPYLRLLKQRLKYTDKAYTDLVKAPLCAHLPDGGKVVWVCIADTMTAFARHTLLRKAMCALLEEKPKAMTVVLAGDVELRPILARDTVYIAAVNNAELPSYKSKPAPHNALQSLSIHGWIEDNGYAPTLAMAAGNTLTRQLTMQPPNQLTPAHYRTQVASLAKQHGWKHKEYSLKKLKKMGAGAFVAVAQGSEQEDAAIVHLSYQPQQSNTRIALVGKGICFDTGGHNLKPAKYMQGMHEDMNGSAVALGILQAATAMALPVRIDCWLAIAQNHISARAYKQNDVITALNGTSIEIVHTDAEGRMVLADTLTLASKLQPSLLIDFATLTGSMVGALGNRYSGVLSNRPALLCQAVGAGNSAGERVSAFPFDEDYAEDLESQIADIKQCTLDSEADHILAARFLYRFIDPAIDWLHVDLSAYQRKGGLGAVQSDVNGFGVRFGMTLIQRILETQANDSQVSHNGQTL